MEAMKETIAEADWLSNATRQEALEKVNSYYKSNSFTNASFI